MIYSRCSEPGKVVVKRLSKGVRRGLVVVSALAVGSVGLTACGTQPAAVDPIGIVNAMGMEQAPILAAMHVTGSSVIDGYRFYEGTIDGHRVVDVRSGEKEYAAELATTLMDAHFHISAALLTGTAGSRNPAVNVGDVVVGGFVVDKSSTHYYDGDYESPYTGVEMEVTGTSDVGGAIIGGHGAVGPTPGDARSYGTGSSATTKRYVYVEDLAAPRSLVSLAAADASHLGTVSLADATGTSGAKGTVRSTVEVGVIGSANQWTEPLADQESQNALYQADAGENEGMGFAYANAQLGVPSLVVRGISDSPWYPAAYEGVLAADRAAAVGEYVIDHMPSRVGRAPAIFAMLSPVANAARAGYIVADKVYTTPAGTVTSVQYTDTAGKTVSVPWSFSSEYSAGAGTAEG